MTQRREARELLGLLAAKCQHFAAAPGGIPGLTPEDLAHALGTMHEEGLRLFARVKYVGEAEWIDDLVGVLFRKVTITLDIGTWRVPRRDFIRDMCRLAIIEAIDPQTCLFCGGTAIAIESNKVVPCKHCHEGKRRVRDMDRAHAMGCIKSSWSQHWSDRYEEVRLIVDCWDDRLEGALRKRLKPV